MAACGEVVAEFVGAQSLASDQGYTGDRPRSGPVPGEITPACSAPAHVVVSSVTPKSSRCTAHFGFSTTADRCASDSVSGMRTNRTSPPVPSWNKGASLSEANTCRSSASAPSGLDFNRPSNITPAPRTSLRVTETFATRSAMPFSVSLLIDGLPEMSSFPAQQLLLVYRANTPAP